MASILSSALGRSYNFFKHLLNNWLGMTHLCPVLEALVELIDPILWLRHIRCVSSEIVGIKNGEMGPEYILSGRNIYLLLKSII